LLGGPPAAGDGRGWRTWGLAPGGGRGSDCYRYLDLELTQNLRSAV
jgi:hypothetical protein